MPANESPEPKRTIALVAHDHRKKDLVEGAVHNADTLVRHRLVCTGTTGGQIEKALAAWSPEVVRLRSGPLGGDQQLGALIAEGEIDLFVFLWDPMQPQPHDVDVKALLRIAVLCNVPTACNRATADFVISSALLESGYEPTKKDYEGYLERDLPED